MFVEELRGMGDCSTCDPVSFTDAGTGNDCIPCGSNPSGSIPTTNPGVFGGSGGSDFWSSISAAINNAGKILGTRYSVPQLNQGQYIQTGPNGSVMFQGGPNTVFGQPSLTSLTGGSLGSMLPLLLIGGVALMVLKK